MQSYIVTLKVDFEDGRVDSQETARDFLGEIARQIGDHTVAKQIVGRIVNAEGGEVMADATYKDGKLMTVTANDLAKMNEGQ